MEDEKEVAGKKLTYIELLRSLKGSLERDLARENEIKAAEWLHPDGVHNKPANSNARTTDQATLNDGESSRKITFNDLYGGLKRKVSVERSNEGTSLGHEAEPERE